MPGAQQISRSMRATLPSCPQSARSARRLVTGWTDLPPRTREDLVLIVSELVGNAIRHGSHEPEAIVVVSMQVTPDYVRVEVRDTGPGLADQLDWSQEPRSGGFGLRIITRLAARWGAGPAPGLVWAELEIGDDARS
jgi:two-component sensor histidine kinase